MPIYTHYQWFIIELYNYFYLLAGPPVVFPFRYTSYAEQHRDEVMKILEVIETMEVPILMGDFNHGPGGPGQGRDLHGSISYTF